MTEKAPGPFRTPEEEIAYLREQIAAKERELLSRGVEIDRADHETIARRELQEYGEHRAENVLHQDHRLSTVEEAGHAAHIESAKHKIEEIISLAEERGIRNALSVIERLGDSYFVDEAHRALVEIIRTGKVLADFREGAPAWNVLHMTLFSVALPEVARDGKEDEELSHIIAAMEQLIAGLGALRQAHSRDPFHYSLEIAVSDKSDDIIFYVAVPNEYIDLFEKQVLSLFPHAVVTEEQHDYNIFVEGGSSLLAVADLKRHPIFPLKMYDDFEHDPLRVLLNAFSKIEREGGGASVQFLVRPKTPKYHETYHEIVRRVERGMEVQKAIELSTTLGSVFHFMKDEVFSGGDKNKEDPELKEKYRASPETIELFKMKIEHPIYEVQLRIAVSAREESRARQILGEIEAAFNQLAVPAGNTLVFQHPTGSARLHGLHEFAFRQFSGKHVMPLSERELATLIHFPRGSKELAPQFRQTQAVSAPAPLDVPQEGTLLGVNRHRNVETKIFLTAEDRLRHFYIIGQTGTGKTTLMKNMAIQDIKEGNGVCLIDPHGTDIIDIVASIPKDRMDDLIYFDPSSMDRVLGLNMLEFDPNYPEQKTFVINELFSIFQKLYGANPESMGPMFEQYFRNATALVLEDPASGSTLLDISRVMVDASYRALKLSRAKNPVVIQFWREIATKAGGEAALENIVPYITSKFDVFTANDFMRPIIGQQTSALNFRQIMDEKKILLVNLAKGRLGEINANLIGMIIVGKILMAALSRADSPGKQFPTLYLHIDEFQNITTNSIASILSEARKYKLGLTIAHQYIEQLEENIRDAVFGNVGSMAVFRVGAADAEALKQQFEPIFTENDLIYIPNRHAYVKLLQRGVPTKPFDIETVAPEPVDGVYAQKLIEYSKARHGRLREEVDEEIRARY